MGTTNIVYTLIAGFLIGFISAVGFKNTTEAHPTDKRILVEMEQEIYLPTSASTEGIELFEKHLAREFYEATHPPQKNRNPRVQNEKKAFWSQIRDPQLRAVYKNLINHVIEASAKKQPAGQP